MEPLGTPGKTLLLISSNTFFPRLPREPLGSPGALASNSQIQIWNLPTPRVAEFQIWIWQYEARLNPRGPGPRRKINPAIIMFDNPLKHGDNCWSSELVNICNKTSHSIFLVFVNYYSVFLCFYFQTFLVFSMTLWPLRAPQRALEEPWGNYISNTF